MEKQYVTNVLIVSSFGQKQIVGKVLKFYSSSIWSS